MKKVLYSILFFFISINFISAQSFQLSDKDKNEYSNNDTVIINEKSSVYEIEFGIYVKNIRLLCKLSFTGDMFK